LVDVLQLRFLDLRAHIAFGGKCDCFGEVFAATYDRATDCSSIHDDVEIGVRNSLSFGSITMKHACSISARLM